MPKKSTAKKSSKKATTRKRVVKKSTTKKAAKKTSSTTKKKSSKKTTDPRVLICAGNDECFWTTDGQIIADMRELEAALSSMADEVFSYHVTKDKNDFADWVESVLQDSTCATDLRRSRKPQTAQKVLIRHLKYYT